MHSGLKNNLFYPHNKLLFAVKNINNLYCYSNDLKADRKSIKPREKHAINPEN